MKYSQIGTNVISAGDLIDVRDHELIGYQLWTSAETPILISGGFGRLQIPSGYIVSFGLAFKAETACNLEVVNLNQVGSFIQIVGISDKIGSIYSASPAVPGMTGMLFKNGAAGFAIPRGGGLV